MNAILASLAVLAAVNLDECPKCDKRIKISDDGTTATVNLARLKDDSPDAAALACRTDAMKARAERLLSRGKAVANGNVKCPLMGWSSWNTFGFASVSIGNASPFILAIASSADVLANSACVLRDSPVSRAAVPKPSVHQSG